MISLITSLMNSQHILIHSSVVATIRHTKYHISLFEIFIQKIKNIIFLYTTNIFDRLN